MLDAAGAVVGDPVLVGARAHRRVEERRHVVHRIVEAAGLLQRRSAAEVDETARHGRRTTPGAGALEDQHIGTGPGGFNSRGGAGDAVACDHNVGFLVPGADRRGGHGCDVMLGGHGRIAAGRSLTHAWPQ